jgi:hypothetical protein
MSNFTGITPNQTQTKRSSYLREEFQNMPGILANNCVLPNSNGSYGGKLIAYNGLQATFSPFESIIGSKFHKMSATQSIDLTSIKSTLVYANKQSSNESVTPTLGKVDAVLPNIDSNTIIRYTFSEVGNPIDTSGNVNDIITMIGTTRVSGPFGYGREFDGIDDYMVSNASPFGVDGVNEREMILCFMPLRLTGTQTWVQFGSSVNRWMYITTIGTKLYCGYNDTVNGDTGYDLDVGKVYKISYSYNGKTIVIKINGTIVHTLNATLNTAATSIVFGKGSGFAKGVYYYFEMRNKTRTFEQNAAISNKMLLPCTYEGWQSQYPENNITTGTHTYKFDEINGVQVADDEGTMIGTATGTTIIDSEIGLGKARSFNGTSDYISLGNFQFPSEFSIVCVLNLSDANAIRPIFGNIAANGQGFMIRISQADPYGIYVRNDNVDVAGSVTARMHAGLNFFVFIYKNRMSKLYLNSDTITNVSLFTISAANNPLYIGRDLEQNTFLKGSMEYFAYIPTELSQAEITKIYNDLTKRGKRDIRDDILPNKTNQIPLSFVQTNETELIAYDDESWKYGRRDDYRSGFGNRKVFLGWKYVHDNTSILLKWDNPFGTRKVKAYYTASEDAYGTHECEATNAYYEPTVYSGLHRRKDKTTPFAVKVIDGKIIVVEGVGSVVGGFVGCYGEVIDND